jgi:hypothetical protein
MAKCPEKGECFAKQSRNSVPGWIPGCGLLNNTIFSKYNGCNGHCPFQKKEKRITNGRVYPYADPGMR